MSEAPLPSGCAQRADDGGLGARGAPAPKVSVLIAAWSAEATIARAVDSALDQSVAVEVIVIDDASPDRTAEIVARKASEDDRVRLLRQSENLGPAVARNRGLASARAPWLTVLDADDFFSARDRLERLLSVADAEGADFVADDIWKVAEDAPNGERSRMISSDPIGMQRIDASGFVSGNLSAQRGGRRELGFLKPLMSNRFLTSRSLRYDADLRLGEDYRLYTHALICGAKFLLIDPVGYTAVVRPKSLSGRHPKEAHQRLIDADKELLSLPGVDDATRQALHAHMMEHRKKLAWRNLIDAKKTADPAAAAACFWAPPTVVMDLIGKLSGEARTRVANRLQRQ